MVIIFCAFLFIEYAFAEFTWTYLNSLPLGIYPVDIESIEYDSVHKQWIIASFRTGTVKSFPSDIVYMEYNSSDLSTYTDIEVDGIPYINVNIWRDSIANSTFDNGNETLTHDWNPEGIEVVNNKLYVVDFWNGRVSSWDLDTKILDGNVFITNKDNEPANLNGLCHDPDNTNYLYITDIGQNFDKYGVATPSGNEAIYRLDTDDWSWEVIYDRNSNIEGIGNNTNYTITANGCVIKDGMFYAVNFKAVDEWVDVPGSWITYDIQNYGPWKIDYDMLTTRGGDGLVYIDEINTFFTDDYHNGQVLYYSDDDDNQQFNVLNGLMNMTTPADMAYNPDEQIIAFPQLLTGYVTFIQLKFTITTSTIYPTNTNVSVDNVDIANRISSFTATIFIVIVMLLK
eukprot:303332_1